MGLLSWSLIVCTLNRRTILEKALLTAIKQTWLPQQITLVGPCIAEDADVSYRVSRYYPLVVCTEARLFHAQTPLARISRRRNALMVLLNNVSLFLMNTKQNRAGAILVVCRYVIVRAGLEFLRDSYKPSQGFPHFRGALQAIGNLPKIIRLYSQGKLVEQYPQMQEKLLRS